MSTSPDPEREELLRQAVQNLRSLSAAVDLFTHATGKRLGINATDLQCLNLIHELGTPTAGELAAKTGLTSGSITGVVDRLERAGYVRRQADLSDRRRVRIIPTAQAGRAAQEVFWPLLAEFAQSFSGYSEAELRLIVVFMESTRRLLMEQVGRMRQQER
ncbi:MAG TPA: MarR family transcriptional regulator [Ktedonobacterales bacterium]|nr:MarR family transcriptional regulator [Ktedonobacterales bacterium]